MERGMNKVVLVTRKTRLEELIYKYNTAEQAKFYIEHMGANFSDYMEEDIRYKKAVNTILDIVGKYARVQEINRDFVSNMIFGKNDIVIAAGQDGLVANVMKYLDGQPLIGINPDIRQWDGVLLPFEAEQLEHILPKVIVGSYQFKEITMAEAVTNDDQSIMAVNDLFIGCKTHTSARYDITWNQNTENQSSSGIIISTGLGATGWYKSVMAQANRMAALLGCGPIHDKPLSWEENKLTFVVREPYPSHTTQAGIVYGKIKMNDQFHVTSKMPLHGVIFSDGMENDFIEFNSGTEITVKIAKKKGRLVSR